MTKEDEDRPAKKKKKGKKKKDSSPMLLVVGGGIGFVLLLAIGIGLLIYFLKPDPNAVKPIAFVPEAKPVDNGKKRNAPLRRFSRGSIKAARRSKVAKASSRACAAPSGAPSEEAN